MVEKENYFQYMIGEGCNLAIWRWRQATKVTSTEFRKMIKFMIQPAMNEEFLSDSNEAIFFTLTKTCA